MYRPPAPTSRDLMLKPQYRDSAKLVRAKYSTSKSLPPKPTTPPESIEDTPKRCLEPYPVLSNFMFTDDEIMNSPSFQHHDISSEDEMILRRAGTYFLNQLAQRINSTYETKQHHITQRATCMAMVYFHRFYMHHSLSTFLPLEMGTTCLFLASKCEDCPKKLSEFSHHFFRIAHEDEEKLAEDEIQIFNDMIQAYEGCLLQALAFELYIDLPHIPVITSGFHSDSDKLCKLAWRFSTDILTYTTLCLQYNDKTLAAVALFTAGAYLDIDMEKEYGENWLQKIDPLLPQQQLIRIVEIFVKALKDVKFLIQAKMHEIEDGEVL